MDADRPRRIQRVSPSAIADFAGTSNVLPVTIENGQLDLGFVSVTHDGHLEATAKSETATAIVRPKDFTLAPDGPIEATVRDRFYLGDDVRVRAELPNEANVTIDFGRSGAERAVGDSLTLDLAVDRLHVLE